MASGDQLPATLQTRQEITISEIRLVPVIELEPWAYGSAPRPDSTPWTPEQSEAYWRACLRQGRFSEVNPIARGSWLVPLQEVQSDRLLTKILEAHFADGLPSNLDETGPLSGGFALLGTKHVFILPTCCGDLGNLEEWRKATRQRSSSVEMLWIGHPWLNVWFEAPNLYILQVDEQNRPTSSKELVVDPVVLEQATFEAERGVDRFCRRLVPALRELLGVQEVDSIARVLVGKKTP